MGPGEDDREASRRTEPPRLLHLAHTTSRRGAEVFAAALSTALGERGYDSRAVALQHGDGTLGLDALGARGRSPATLRALRRALHDRDLLIAYGASTLTAGVATTVGGPAMVYRSIGDPRFWARVRGRRLRIGVPLRATARVVALWPEAAEALRALYGLRPEQVVVIPNGRDPRHFEPADATDRDQARRQLGLPLDLPLVGYVGSLSWEKQPMVVVDAVRGLPDVGLVVAGTGPLLTEVRSAGLREPDRIRVLGPLADPRVVYRAVDALALPSATEGMPGVVIEAALSGVPTVATDVGACRELVDETTGELVAGTDADDLAPRFAAALGRVLGDAAARGEGARRRALERYTTDLVVQRWSDLLHEVHHERDPARLRPRPWRQGGTGDGVDGATTGCRRDGAPTGGVTSRHVSATAQRRGAEIFAADLVGALRTAGDDAGLRALQPAGANPHLGVPVLADRRFGVEPFLALRTFLAAPDGPRVAVAHGASTVQAVAAALVGTDVPWVYRNIGDPLYWGRVRAARLRVGLPLRRADRLVALWPAAADALVDLYGIEPSRIVVVPNAVDRAHFGPVGPDVQHESRRSLGLDDRPTVAWLGSLSPEKDPLLAVAVGALLEGLNLVVVGDGPLRDAVSDAVRRAAPERIRVLPTVEDVRPVLAAADAVLLTSRTEGLPAVAIEGGLSGLPVVAPDVGGVAEVVTPTTGVVTGSRDAPALAAAVRRALDGRDDLGAAARDRCLARFTLEVIAPDWRDVLAETAR